MLAADMYTKVNVPECAAIHKYEGQIQIHHPNGNLYHPFTIHMWQVWFKQVQKARIPHFFATEGVIWVFFQFCPQHFKF